jgi:hypothetical protein
MSISKIPKRRRLGSCNRACMVFLSVSWESTPAVAARVTYVDDYEPCETLVSALEVRSFCAVNSRLVAYPET